MCLTQNEKILLKIFGGLFLQNLLQRWKSEQCYFLHEVMFVWGMSVKKLLYISVQNLIILTVKKCSGKYEVIDYVINFLSSNYDTAQRNESTLTSQKTLFLGSSVRKTCTLEMKFNGVSVSKLEDAV